MDVVIHYFVMNDRADYMEDEQIQVVLKYQPEWISQLKQWNEQVCLNERINMHNSYIA